MGTSRNHPVDDNVGNGFTLVELLVVIGIIAVLVSVLLPSLASARRAAQMTQCLAIQRQIATGALLHASNHRNYFPLAGHFKGIKVSGGRVTPESVNDGSRRKYTYTYVAEPWAQATVLAPWHAAIAIELGKRHATDGGTDDEIADRETGLDSYLKYFLCPSHRDKSTDIEQESIIYYGGGGRPWLIKGSYVVNEAVFGIDDSLGRVRGNAARVRKPAQTVMLSDGNMSSVRDYTTPGGAYNWATFINKTALPPVTLADALANNALAGDRTNFDRARHKGKINILFCDGHAETRTIAASDLQSTYLLAN
jgi:prepilin-type processing-associated H-X9-DG protein/prepilin-type N-terminal cleavage/methylation domain-containing protein